MAKISSKSSSLRTLLERAAIFSFDHGVSSEACLSKASSLIKDLDIQLVKTDKTMTEVMTSSKIMIGILLIDMKDFVEQSCDFKWEYYVDTNLDISPSTCRKYIRLAESNIDPKYYFLGSEKLFWIVSICNRYCKDVNSELNIIVGNNDLFSRKDKDEMKQTVDNWILANDISRPPTTVLLSNYVDKLLAKICYSDRFLPGNSVNQEIFKNNQSSSITVTNKNNNETISGIHNKAKILNITNKMPSLSSLSAEFENTIKIEKENKIKRSITNDELDRFIQVLLNLKAQPY